MTHISDQYDDNHIGPFQVLLELRRLLSGRMSKITFFNDLRQQQLQKVVLN